MNEQIRTPLERQEMLTSALWGFAWELQNSELETTCEGDGTKMNLASLGRARELILGIFGQKPIEIE